MTIRGKFSGGDTVKDTPNQGLSVIRLSEPVQRQVVKNFVWDTLKKISHQLRGPLAPSGISSGLREGPLGLLWKKNQSGSNNFTHACSCHDSAFTHLCPVVRVGYLEDLEGRGHPAEAKVGEADLEAVYDGQQHLEHPLVHGPLQALEYKLAIGEKFTSPEIWEAFFCIALCAFHLEC